jgi:hypothetical protein
MAHSIDPHIRQLQSQLLSPELSLELGAAQESLSGNEKTQVRPPLARAY